MPTQHKKGKKNVHKKHVSQHANYHQEPSPMKLRARENTPRRPTILVAGCGFGGLEAAVLLKKKLGENARIICLDRKKHHTYYGAIFELLQKGVVPENLHTYYARVFPPRGISFYRREIVGLDTRQRKVITNKEAFPYDYLILNFGSEPCTYNIPGSQNAIPVKSVSCIELLQQRVRERLDHYQRFGRFAQEGDSTIVMVGGGISGIEVMAELHYYLRAECTKYGADPALFKLVLVERAPFVAPLFSPPCRKKVARHLRRLGITIHTSVAVTSVTKTKVHLSDGTAILAGVVLWAAGLKPARVCTKLSLPLDSHGALIIRPDLRVEGQTRVYACGDCTSFQPKPLPKLATVALEQGRLIAKNIVRDIAGKPLKPYTPPVHYLVIIHLAGRQALLVKGNVTWQGNIPYLLKKKLGEAYLHRYDA